MNRVGILTLLSLHSLAGGVGTTDIQITAIRQNYSTVNKNVQSATYRKQVKTFPYCSGGMGQEHLLWTDRRGVPRLYIERGGSDDSAVTISHYLDERGKIDFVFVEWNSVWEQSGTLRLYYSPSGQVIRRLESGLQWFDQSSIRRDVLKAFDASYAGNC